MSENKDLVKTDNNEVESYRKTYSATPPVDIFENENELLLITDLPGVKKEDLTVHLEKSTLSIEGRRMLDTLGLDGTTEFEELDYVRSFRVPKGIDSEKIEAKLNEGVLEVHLPKAPEIKPRQIEIQAG